jgi:ABC-type phosphate transport system permease subunit
MDEGRAAYGGDYSMTFDALLGMSFVLCLGLVVFGLVKGFSWFIIKGALVNGPSFLASLWGIHAGVSNAIATSTGTWWLLAVVGAVFALVCGFNLYNYLSGKEAEMLARMIVQRLSGNQN